MPETNAAGLINMSSSRPKDNECLAAYAARLMATSWKGLSTEEQEIAVATVMSHIAQFDSRVQRLAFTTDIASRNQMQQELRAMSFMKRRAVGHHTEDSTECKQRKLSATVPASNMIKCFTCGKLGHKCRNIVGIKTKQHSRLSVYQKMYNKIISLREGIFWGFWRNKDLKRRKVFYHKNPT